MECSLKCCFEPIHGWMPWNHFEKCIFFVLFDEFRLFRWCAFWRSSHQFASPPNACVNKFWLIFQFGSSLPFYANGMVAMIHILYIRIISWIIITLMHCCSSELNYTGCIHLNNNCFESYMVFSGSYTFHIIRVCLGYLLFFPPQRACDSQIQTKFHSLHISCIALLKNTIKFILSKSFKHLWSMWKCTQHCWFPNGFRGSTKRQKRLSPAQPSSLSVLDIIKQQKPKICTM